jgi:hypothetical protein
VALATGLSFRTPETLFKQAIQSCRKTQQNRGLLRLRKNSAWSGLYQGMASAMPYKANKMNPGFSPRGMLFAIFAWLSSFFRSLFNP